MEYYDSIVLTIPCSIDEDLDADGTEFKSRTMRVVESFLLVRMLRQYYQSPIIVLFQNNLTFYEIKILSDKRRLKV